MIGSALGGGEGRAGGSEHRAGETAPSLQRHSRARSPDQAADLWSHAAYPSLGSRHWGLCHMGELSA